MAVQGWTLAYSGRRVSLAWQTGPAVGPGSKKSQGSWYGLGPGENAQAAAPLEGQPRQRQWLQEETALADEYVFNWSDVSKCFGHDISRDSYPSRTVNIIHSFTVYTQYC